MAEQAGTMPPVAPDPSSTPTISGTVLDHVAHAVHRWHDVWHRYATDLGAEWNSGGPGPGFAPAQLRFANRARVEVLMPDNTEVNDFLIRFLSANGPGAHHMTFKVPSLEEAIATARAAGHEPIGINKEDPEWMECFLHPKSAWGVVVQLAEQRTAWTSDPPWDYPQRRRSDASGTPLPPATLAAVVHVVADLDGASALFRDLLAATEVDEGHADGVAWRELVWSGPLRLRLVGPVDPSSPGEVITHYLDGRAGRVHHLDLVAPDPESLPQALPLRSPDPLVQAGAPDAAVVIPANENAGLALGLTPA